MDDGSVNGVPLLPATIHAVLGFQCGAGSGVTEGNGQQVHGVSGSIPKASPTNTKAEAQTYRFSLPLTVTSIH